MFFLKSNNNNFIRKWKYKTEAIRNQILKIIIKKKKKKINSNLICKVFQSLGFTDGHSNIRSPTEQKYR